LTLSNTSSFLNWSAQLISILLQHHISKLSKYFWSTFRSVHYTALNPLPTLGDETCGWIRPPYYALIMTRTRCGVQSYPVSCVRDSTMASSLSVLNDHCDVSLRPPITAPVWGSVWHVGEFMTQQPWWRWETPEGQWANEGVICRTDRPLPACTPVSHNVTFLIPFSTKVTPGIAWFNIKIFCILHTQCKHGWMNTDDFPKQHKLIGYCSGDAVCFLRY
jgi:hypothetical protein